MVSSLAKETGSVLTVGTGRIYSDGRSGEDKCSSTEELEARTEDRTTKKRPLCDRGE